MVGRNHRDNEELKPLIRDADILLKQHDAPGPLTVLDGDASEEDILSAAALTARYTKTGAKGERVSIVVIRPEGKEELLQTQPMSLLDIEEYRLG